MAVIVRQFLARIVCGQTGNMTSSRGAGSEDTATTAAREAEQRRLDASYRNLERIAGWITNADNKALILLTFQGAVVAGVAATAGAARVAIDQQPMPALAWVLWGLLGLGLLAFGGSVYTSLRAIVPDITPREREAGHQSPFYFASIAALSLEHFSARMRALDTPAIEKELLRQTHVNAGIALRKFQRVNYSVKWLGVELVCLVLAAFILTATPASGIPTGAAPTPSVAPTPTISAPAEAEEGAPNDQR